MICNLCEQMNNGKSVCYSKPGGNSFCQPAAEASPDAEVSKGLFQHHSQPQGLMNKLHLVFTVPALLHGSPLHPRVVVSLINLIGLKITLEIDRCARL